MSRNGELFGRLDTLLDMPPEDRLRVVERSALQGDAQVDAVLKDFSCAPRRPMRMMQRARRASLRFRKRCWAVSICKRVNAAATIG